ncbi:MAG TPA: IS1595 family transposase [bacterium]|nr:IS1595 family transposase [bacterium]
MQKKAMSLLEFQKMFGTERKCSRYLQAQKWPEGKYVCPRCGGTESYPINARHQYECKRCHHQTSLTAGTIMHKSKTPLVKWFWAIYLSSRDKGGISALGLSKHISVTYKTAWLMLHKIREAMKSRDAEYLLSGIVEVDEAYFTGSKKNEDDKNVEPVETKRGRGTDKAKVLISVGTNPETNRPSFAKMTVVSDVTGRTLIGGIEKTVTAGSTIRTDGYAAYNALSEAGYKHKTTDDTMKWVHIVISNAKTFLRGTYHGACKNHLQSYLDEFCYRFNRRFWEDQLFTRTLYACALAKPFPLNALVERGRKG